MVETSGKKILFDPFITYNDLAKNIDISSINPHFILLSHGIVIILQIVLPLLKTLAPRLFAIGKFMSG
jgi:hypothetical protein